MKKFKTTYEVSIKDINNDPYIAVGNIVYRKIQIIGETIPCYYSEEEKHLIRVIGIHVHALYCFLDRVSHDLFSYKNKGVFR